ncbi:hypothetical protein PWT90_01740 [Aphanocladium album]|nr:hypothetical protein PWT90_01740 [Aphanocladium album]
MTPDEVKKFCQTATLTCKDAEEARDRDAGLPLLEVGAENAQPRPSSIVVLPGRGASVTEVREYIIKTLVEKHNTTLEYAQRTALKWHLGKGWVLRDLPTRRFSEIFGDDIGPHLASDVYGARIRESHEEMDKPWYDWKKTTGPRNFKDLEGSEDEIWAEEEAQIKGI